MCERDKFHKVESSSSRKTARSSHTENMAHTQIAVGVWIVEREFEIRVNVGQTLFWVLGWWSSFEGISLFLFYSFCSLLYRCWLWTMILMRKVENENVISQRTRPRERVNEGMKSIINVEQAHEWWFSIQKLACSVQTLNASKKLKMWILLISTLQQSSGWV